MNDDTLADFQTALAELFEQQLPAEEMARRLATDRWSLSRAVRAAPWVTSTATSLSWTAISG